MKKCANCGVILRDPVPVCPLCKCIAADVRDDEKWTVSPEPAYPYADRGPKRIRFALRIYLFAALVVFVILAIFNLYFQQRFWWSILILACLGYGYVTVAVSVKRKIELLPKIVVQSLLAFLLLILIDYHTGFYGWSLNIVLPAALVGLTVLIGVLILHSKTNWQSYILLQIMMIFLALIPFGLYPFGLFHSWTRAVVVFLITLLAFAGTIIVGGRTARDELVRRFHV